MEPLHMEKSVLLVPLIAAGLVFFLRRGDAAKEQVPRMEETDAEITAKIPPGRRVVPFLTVSNPYLQ